MPTQSGDVLFGQSVTLRCGKYENDNYFSTVEENKQHRIECKARDSFNVRIDSQLGCDKCSDVAGCAVPETCTTQDNSRCADCSDLKDSPKGAYHDDRGISTICKKCGVDCSSENSVVFCKRLLLLLVVITHGTIDNATNFFIPGFYSCKQ